MDNDVSREGMGDRSIAREDITGLVLAGGKGLRMGGVDKGLAMLMGQPMALWALRRLAPQVGSVMVSANRNADAYASFGCPVLADASTNFDGPLAGLLAGLQACPTDYLLCAPCDAPRLPMDYAQRMKSVMAEQGCSVVFAANMERVEGGANRLQTQPTFCLARKDSADSLADFLAGGERKVLLWGARSGRMGAARFDDELGFFNTNTKESLLDLESRLTAVCRL
jgi:molybdopterin-guanine dinucleotide biosynthesis protein A